MKKYSFEIEEQVRYRHSITIETELEESEVSSLLDAFDSYAVHMCMGLHDMGYFFEEKGIKVVEICEDEDGEVSDIESSCLEETE